MQNFGRIIWDAETPSGTRLEVRTRSGDRISRIVNYYNKTGEFWGNEQNVELDVGCGRGLFLFNASLRNPETNYLGLELDFCEGRRTAKRLVQREAPNARVVGVRHRLRRRLHLHLPKWYVIKKKKFIFFNFCLYLV